MGCTPKLLFGPGLITATGGTYQNLFTSNSTAIFYIVKHIHVANNDASNIHTFYLCLTTVSGTDNTGWLFGLPVVASSTYDWYSPGLVIPQQVSSTIYYLNAAADVTNKLIITVEGEGGPV